VLTYAQVNGWEEATLQNALDKCVDGVPNCAESTFGTFNTQGETQSCKAESMIDETVNGVLDALPGCNPVSYGPAPAPVQQNCNAPKLMTVATPEMAGYVDVTSKGYKYIGCGLDNALTRTLNGGLLAGDDMTVEECVDFCKSKNTQYAGIVYGSQCYCGATVAEDRKPGTAKNCLMKCGGNKNEVCGGADAISLYEACSGGACTNPTKRDSRRLVSLNVARANASL
jgi:hypothetical protein